MPTFKKLLKTTYEFSELSIQALARKIYCDKKTKTGKQS
jgi:hypothetical protein